MMLMIEELVNEHHFQVSRHTLTHTHMPTPMYTHMPTPMYTDNLT